MKASERRAARAGRAVLGPSASPSPGRPPRGWLRTHAVWLAVAAAYLLVFPYFGRLNNPNENVRVWTTRAIVDHGTFSIDAVEREWGAVSDRAEHGGRRYAAKAPGTSLLGVPVHFVHSKLSALVGAGSPSKRATIWVLRVFAVALPLVAFLWYFGRRVERETGSAAARELLVLALGLGTMLYPYGLTFAGHALSAALLFAGFLCAAEAAGGRRLALGGLLAGLAVVFEYQALFAAAVVTAFVVVVHRRRAGRFFLGALGPALLLAGFHAALFGRPWETPLGHVDDPVYRLFHQQGFLGLGLPRPQVWLEALFSADYGIFVFSPVLAAGLVSAAALVARERRRAEAWVVLAVLVVMLLFLAGMSNWRGGWCAGGPRYVATVVPFLVWGLALGWQRLAARPVVAAGLAGLVLASVALCTLAGAHFPHYPLQFDNPVFDLTIPLLAAGYAPYGLGWLLGLRGAASYLPLAAAVLTAVVLAVRSLRLRPAGVAVALAVAVTFVGGLALYGRRYHPDETMALGVVQSLWEPPARGGGDGAP